MAAKTHSDDMNKQLAMIVVAALAVLWLSAQAFHGHIL